MPALLNQRPFVAFDASKKQHREFFAEFVRTGSWSKCPVRFYVPEDTGMDQVTMIRSMLVQYYVEKEFGVKDIVGQQFFQKAA